MRVKIKRIEQEQGRNKEGAYPPKRKRDLDPGPSQARIHKFFQKVTKAEEGSSRASTTNNQGATCGPLKGVTGKGTPSRTSRGAPNLTPVVRGRGEKKEGKKKATTALDRWLTLSRQQEPLRYEDQGQPQRKY